jgi:hypothetical protein
MFNEYFEVPNLKSIFDVEFYKKTYRKDTKHLKNKEELFQHFLIFGLKEGWLISPNLPFFLNEIKVDEKIVSTVKKTNHTDSVLHFINTIKCNTERVNLIDNLAFYFKNEQHIVLKNFLLGKKNQSKHLLYLTEKYIFISSTTHYNTDAIYDNTTRDLYIKDESLKQEYIECISSFKFLIFKHRTLFQNHIKNNNNIKLCTFLGTKQIMHHYINDLQGVETLSKDIDLTALYSYFEYYGPHERVLSFCDKTKIIRDKDVEELFIDTCKKNLFFIKHITSFVTKELNDRVLKYALENFDKSSLKLKFNKCILFTVRCSHRMLKNQAEFIATCIHEFEKRYPNSLYLIDGMSRLHSTSYTEESPLVRFEKNVFNEIQNLIPSNIQLQSILFQDINTFIQYAQIVDFYIANIGTCQHKLGYFSRASGIVHGGGESRHAEVSDQGWYWESHFGQVCRRMSNDFFKYDNINDYNSNYIADLELVKEWATQVVV